jgi:ubiquinone/menaquinone biosynthesis C-methylase UbiE
VCSVIADREDTYERLWSQTLATQTAPKLKVLELACGSANDYRYFDSYGLARFLVYTGIDLNEKNVVNAKKRFPGVRFDQGSILDLPYESSSFDYVTAFDIFEHLSLQAMEHAMAQAVRVTKRGFLVAFFIMADVPGHTERPKETYHWNELSADQIRTAMVQRHQRRRRTRRGGCRQGQRAHGQVRCALGGGGGGDAAQSGIINVMLGNGRRRRWGG